MTRAAATPDIGGRSEPPEDPAANQPEGHKAAVIASVRWQPASPPTVARLAVLLTALTEDPHETEELDESTDARRPVRESLDRRAG